MIDHDADIEIVNPDLVICNLVKGGKIDIEMTVDNGRGFNICSNFIFWFFKIHISILFS